MSILLDKWKERRLQSSLKKKLAEVLGYKPKDVAPYLQAFNHKSANKGIESNNERLEFLGDSVLDLVVSEHLFNRFPKKNEGFLTQQRSRYVSRSSLNRIAFDLNLDKYIKCKIDLPIEQTSICGNTLEALVGAIYVDRGFDKAVEFINEKLLINADSFVEDNKEEFDPKSRLIEHCQQSKKHIIFETEASNKKEADRKFVSQITINGQSLGRGFGASKKKAEQQASKNVLNLIRK